MTHSIVEYLVYIVESMALGLYFSVCVVEIFFITYKCLLVLGSFLFLGVDTGMVVMVEGENYIVCLIGTLILFIV